MERFKGPFTRRTYLSVDNRLVTVEVLIRNRIINNKILHNSIIFKMLDRKLSELEGILAKRQNWCNLFFK